MRIVYIILLTFALISFSKTKRWKYQFQPSKPRTNYPKGRAGRLAFRAEVIPEFKAHLETKLIEFKAKAESEPEQKKWAKKIKQIETK